MRLFFIPLLLALLTASLNAQVKATTEDGKKVWLYEDGTWKPREEVTLGLPQELDCGALVKVEEDRVTGNRTVQAVEPLVIWGEGAHAVAVNVFQSKDAVVILGLASEPGSGCIDDDATINILFRDGTRLELKNDGDFDCKGKFSIYLGGIFGKKKALRDLRGREVEIIRVWTTDGYVERELTPEQSKVLMKTIDCIAK